MCSWSSLYCTQVHYNDVIMSAMASQITSLTIAYRSVYSRRRLKKTSKLRVTGLCEGNSSVTGEFPAQRAGDTDNVSIWWRHHVYEISAPEDTWIRTKYRVTHIHVMYTQQHLKLKSKNRCIDKELCEDLEMNTLQSRLDESHYIDVKMSAAAS